MLLVLASPAVAAAANVPVSAQPQPRARLSYTAAVAPTRSEGRATPMESDGSAVQMDKVVVSDSKLPLATTSSVPRPPTTFSVVEGGPVRSVQVGGARVDLGLMASVDILAADAAFKPQKTRADLDVVRVRW